MGLMARPRRRAWTQPPCSRAFVWLPTTHPGSCRRSGLRGQSSLSERKILRSRHPSHCPERKQLYEKWEVFMVVAVIDESGRRGRPWAQSGFATRSIRPGIDHGGCCERLILRGLAAGAATLASLARGSEKQADDQENSVGGRGANPVPGSPAVVLTTHPVTEARRRARGRFAGAQTCTGVSSFPRTCLCLNSGTNRIAMISE